MNEQEAKMWKEGYEHSNYTDNGGERRRHWDKVYTVKDDTQDDE